MSSLPLFSFFFPCLLPSMLSSIELQSPINGAILPSQGMVSHNGIRADVLGGPVLAPTPAAPRSNRPTAIAVDLLLSLQLRAKDGREELDLDGDSRRLQPPDPWPDLDLDPPWRELATAAIVDPHVLDAMLPFSLHRRITDVLSLDRPIWSDSTPAASFLGLIRDLEPPAFDRADDLLQQCVLRLEDEFKTILEGSAVDPIQSSPFESDDEESDGDDEIQRWIRGVTLAVRVLFPSERRLCERIFANLSPIAELAYAESCRGSAIQLIVSGSQFGEERIVTMADFSSSGWRI